MIDIKSTSTHNLIPEKVPTFSCKTGTYFSDFLEPIASKLDETVVTLKEWEDETVLIMLEDKKLFLSALDKQKLLAYKNFNEKECSIQTPLEFSNMACLLNNDIPVTDTLDTIDPAYIAWAIEVLEEFDSNTEIEITDDVADYIALCFFEEGFSYMPESLDIFNVHLQAISSVPGIENQETKFQRIEDYLKEKRKDYTLTSEL